jgi:hypothetical protein
MERVAAAARAKLLNRKFFGLAFLIFAGRVIAPLATVAGHSNQISHRSTSRVLSALI